MWIIFCEKKNNDDDNDIKDNDIKDINLTEKYVTILYGIQKLCNLII